MFEHGLAAAVRRVSLSAALEETVGEHLEAAGRRQVGVDVAVREIDARACQLFAAQVEPFGLLQAFLAGRVIDAEHGKLFNDIHEECRLSS